MKKKKVLSQPLTKKDFEKAISKLATKKELKKYSTKKDLRDIEQNLKITIAANVSDLETRTNDKAQKYHDDILNKFDKVIGELETIREEQTVGFHQYKELQEQVNGHDKKIKKIEQSIHVV